MNKKSFIIILIIAAVCIGIALVISNKKRAESSISSEQLFAPELKGKLKSVEKIIIQHSGVNPLTFTRTNNRWQLVEKSGYKANFKAIRELLTNLSEAKLFEAKTQKKENYIQLGVEEVTQEKGSGSRVMIYGAKDQLLEDVIIGRYKINNGTYLRKASEKQSWLSKSKVIVSSNFIEWLDKKIIKMPVDMIKSVSYKPTQGEQYTIMRDTQKDEFKVRHGGNVSEPKNPRFVENLARLLDNLEYTDIAKRVDGTTASSTFSTRVYTTFDGIEIAVKISPQLTDKTSQVVIDFAAVAGSESTELGEKLATYKKNISPWVFTVQDHIFTKFNKTLGDIVALEEKAE